MTIDTNELRRLAQAATPGPWYVTGRLTRYVEARIDGGLIQEVAACGPTKADGGYGPQQEANARLIAAANPATINDLLDRLEAAEKDVTLKERVIDAIGSTLNAVANERDALRAESDTRKALIDVLRAEIGGLRAKIEAMEKQEPARLVTPTAYRWRYRGAIKWQYGELTEEAVQVAKEHNHEVQSLYALPGAQGE